MFRQEIKVIDDQLTAVIIQKSRLEHGSSEMQRVEERYRDIISQLKREITELKTNTLNVPLSTTHIAESLSSQLNVKYYTFISVKFSNFCLSSTSKWPYFYPFSFPLQEAPSAYIPHLWNIFPTGEDFSWYYLLAELKIHLEATKEPQALCYYFSGIFRRRAREPWT